MAIDQDPVPGQEVAIQDFQCQRVLDEPLDGALERLRAELRVVASAEANRSAVGVLFHCCSKQVVQACLIALTLRLQPCQNIGVEPDS